MRGPTITSVAFTRASAADERAGLLGWATCVIDEHLMLDGVAVRRTRDGKITLSYPTRRDRAGRKHAIVRPIHDKARRVIEAQILTALGIDPERPQ